MISDVDKYVSFLADNHITEHQFLILWLVYTKDTANIKKYKQSFGDFDYQAIQYLIDSGWLDDFGIAGQAREYNIYDFIVTEKFMKVVIDEEDAYKELCDVYPKWMVVKGTKWPMIKGDPEENAKHYKRFHKNNRLVHDRVIRITKEYFKTNPVQSNILDYIQNRRWELLDAELKQGVGKDAFRTL